MSEHSWKIIDENTIRKTTDLSFFEHRGSGLPMDVRSFFMEHDLMNGERKEIQLVFKGITYNAHIIKESSDASRTRIFWSGGLQCELTQYYTNRHFPDVYFVRMTTNKYLLTFEEPAQVKKEVAVQNVDSGESTPLYKMLSRLSISSKEMIASGNQELDAFNEYLHVKKPIEDILLEKIDKALASQGNQLLLLVGSVGDGKSHLLSYFKKRYPEKMSQFYIHNDATESFEPTKDSIETLKEYIFDKFEQEQNQKIILAINLGVLYNFVNRFGDKFNTFKQYIDETQIFEKKHNEFAMSNSFQIVSFADYKMFELTQDGPTSFFITEILNKIISIDERNPFYLAYKQTKEHQSDSHLIRNFELVMENDFVRENLVQLIIRALIENKLMLSTRDLLDFFFVLFTNNDTIQNTLFEKSALDSKLLSHIVQFDPLLERSLEDEIHFVQQYKIEKRPLNELKEEYRLHKLKTENVVKNPTYLDFVHALYEYYTMNIRSLVSFSNATINCIRLWNGNAGSDKIFIDSTISNYRIAIHYELEALEKSGSSRRLQIAEQFDYAFNLYFQVYNREFVLSIDANLFALIEKMANYYRPTKIDREAAISFTEVVDKITEALNERATTITLINKEENSEIKMKSTWGTISIS